MMPVFADTYYWLALINPRDGAHREAVAISQTLTERLVTTTAVLTEVGDAMCAPANKPTFVKLLDDLASDTETTIIPPTQDWFERGVKLYAARLDKKWSLTDCISFAVMHELSLTSALTADGDFVQAGFQILMKRDA